MCLEHLGYLGRDRLKQKTSDPASGKAQAHTQQQTTEHGLAGSGRTVDLTPSSIGVTSWPEHVAVVKIPLLLTGSVSW